MIRILLRLLDSLVEFSMPFCFSWSIHLALSSCHISHSIAFSPFSPLYLALPMSFSCSLFLSHSLFLNFSRCIISLPRLLLLNLTDNLLEQNKNSTNVCNHKKVMCSLRNEISVLVSSIFIILKRENGYFQYSRQGFYCSFKISKDSDIILECHISTNLLQIPLVNTFSNIFCKFAIFIDELQYLFL